MIAELARTIPHLPIESIIGLVLVGGLLGTAGHWSVNTPPHDHGQCVALWESIRRLHLNSGYSDIAYNFGVCDHGIVLVGRGWGRVSGANGTRWANLNVWAVCWLGGPGHAPSLAARAAFAGLVRSAPNTPPHADPHHRFTSTACPGPDWTSYIIAAFPRVGAPGVPNPASPSFPGGDDEMNELQNAMLKDVYDRVRVLTDGVPQFGIEGAHVASTKALMQLEGRRADPKVPTVRELVAKPTTTVQVDAGKLATAIVARIGPAQAEAIADELAARLKS